MKTEKMILYGGLGLGAFLLLKKASPASAAANFKVTDAAGKTVGTYATVAQAEAAAKNAGDATTSARVYDATSGLLIYTYISPTYAASSSGGSGSGGSGGGVDWNPMDSPYFDDAVNAVGSFFGMGGYSRSAATGSYSRGRTDTGFIPAIAAAAILAKVGPAVWDRINKAMHPAVPKFKPGYYRTPDGRPYYYDGHKSSWV